METIGVLIFLLIIGMAMWMLIFLASFVPFIITGFALDLYAPKIANKIFGEADPNAVRSYPVAGEPAQISKAASAEATTSDEPAEESKEEEKTDE